MSQPDTVSIQEIADIFGEPFAAAKVEQDLRAEGYAIVRDWAGRPALAFRDAERKVTAWRKFHDAQVAEYEAQRAMVSMVHNAQLERDRLFQAEYGNRRRSAPVGGDRVKVMRKDYDAAAKAVLAAEKRNGLARDVQKQLGWLSIDRMVY